MLQGANGHVSIELADDSSERLPKSASEGERVLLKAELAVDNQRTILQPFV